LQAAKTEELAEVNGIGAITAGVITEGLDALSVSMRRVLDTPYVSIASPVTGSLSGSTFCFTGTLSTMTRAHAQELVREAGGRVSSSVTRDLSYLVTNSPESGSSKNRKAAEYGVEIISEEAFVQMLGAGK
jgi:DNA ligase (NAD+)